MAQVKIDPLLEEQLEASSAGGEPVGAVFTLKTGGSASSYRRPRWKPWSAIF